MRGRGASRGRAVSPRSSLVGRLLVVQATGVGGGVVAANVGAGSQLTQTVVDPDWRSGGNLNPLTDLVQRVR